MPQWDKCDPIEVSIVPGECGPSKAPKEECCGNPPAEAFASIFNPGEVSIPSVAPPPPISLSTTLYPIEDIQQFASFGSPEFAQTQITPLEEYQTFGSVLEASTRVLLLQYNDWFPEEPYQTGGELLGVDVRIAATYSTYTMDPEDYTSNGVLLAVDVVTFPDLTVTYSNWTADEMSSTGSFISGVLS